MQHLLNMIKVTSETNGNTALLWHYSHNLEDMRKVENYPQLPFEYSIMSTNLVILNEIDIDEIDKYSQLSFQE